MKAAKVLKTSPRPILVKVLLIVVPFNQDQVLLCWMLNEKLFLCRETQSPGRESQPCKWKDVMARHRAEESNGRCLYMCASV